MARILEILRARPVRVALTFLMTALLAAVLVMTLYWSRFDVKWLMFLGGVLFAAVLAVASQMSKAEWLVMRRTRQLERARIQLSQEAERSRRATEAMRMLESRLQLVGNALPSLILFVDRDEHCRFHNRAVERKTGLPGEKITGRLLRDVVGTAAYAGIAPHIADTLAGKTVEYEIVWESPGSQDLAYAVRLLPYPPDNAQPIGFYLLATAVISASGPVPAVAGKRAARATAGIPGVAAGDDDALFARLVSDELTSWEDPRAGLIRALEQNQFLLFAQKVLPLKSALSDPAPYEVLLRLREEEENLLPPGSFIPIAEHLGMMEQLDRWVVRNLIAWCLEKRKHNPSWRVPLFSVNLSGSAVTSQEFPYFVLEELQRTGFAAHSLCFEIGEQDIINFNGEVRQFIAALKPAGCRFAVDNFGSVKVSFSHLRNLPIDFVKIDGTLVQNLARDASALAKVRGINTVCQKLGIRTVAMFVENGETLDKLREIGLDYVQGFGIARPEPIDRISQAPRPVAQAVTSP